MKRFITACMLLAGVICYGLEIHTPTKKEKEILNKWERSNKFSLFDCYKSFSQKKQESFAKILNFKSTKKNTGVLKILGASSCFYSTGFYFEENNKKYFCYDTKNNKKIFEVMEG